MPRSWRGCGKPASPASPCCAGSRDTALIIRSTRRVSKCCQGLPIIIEAVDTAEHVANILPVLDEMVVEGLVTIRDVTAVTYSK